MNTPNPIDFHGFEKGRRSDLVDLELPSLRGWLTVQVEVYDDTMKVPGTALLN